MSGQRFGTLEAVMLAAGVSRRFGERNKLLESVDGMPLVRRTAKTLLDGGVGRLVVVLGFEAEKVKAALAGIECDVRVNRRYEEGMGASLAVGARALGRRECEGILVCLADLPLLSADDVAAVCSGFMERSRRSIVMPVFHGRRGHPVCFPRSCWSELERLEGDQGAKRVIAANSSIAYEVAVDSDGCIRDWDTPGPV